MAKNVPFNLEAEQMILGCVLIDNQIMLTLSDELELIDFYDEKHRTIFMAMIQLLKKQIIIDYTTLTAELTVKNKLNEAGGLIYITSLVDLVYTTANVKHYIEIIKDLSYKRRIYDAGIMISEGIDKNDTGKDYIQFAEKAIFELSKRQKTEGFANIEKIVEDVSQKMLLNRSNANSIMGLSTGFSNLDSVTLGLQKDNLIILAARPGMGKSAFAMNIATGVARNNPGKPHVAVFTLEMSQEQNVQRLLAASALVPIQNIQLGNFSAQQFEFLENAKHELAELNLHFCDSSMVTVADIRAKCRKQKMQEGLDLVIIDYLQLINGDSKSGNRQEEVSNISRNLKQMARELEVPVIAIAQLSREVEKREDKRPIMADLRESGSIEQDADIILFLYREDYYNKTGGTTPNTNNRSNRAQLKVAKNRQGVSDIYLDYIFKGEYSRFSMVEDDSE